MKWFLCLMIFFANSTFAVEEDDSLLMSESSESAGSVVSEENNSAPQPSVEVAPKPEPQKRWYRREKVQGTKAQRRFKKNPVVKSVYRDAKGRRYDVDPD